MHYTVTQPHPKAHGYGRSKTPSPPRSELQRSTPSIWTSIYNPTDQDNSLIPALQCEGTQRCKPRAVHCILTCIPSVGTRPTHTAPQH